MIETYLLHIESMHSLIKKEQKTMPIKIKYFTVKKSPKLHRILSYLVRWKVRPEMELRWVISPTVSSQVALVVPRALHNVHEYWLMSSVDAGEISKKCSSPILLICKYI